ncbi:MAG TPA: pirin family protein [Actinomycetota bacterium]
MPAVTADTLTLPRITAVDPAGPFRPALGVVDAPTTFEGEGFQVRRAFPGIDHRLTDPFILMDHLGAVEYAPGEAKGAPDHPHRGFETVTYVLDGAIEHKDSTGGGGLITDGKTQWMTAGAGIVHSELPTEELVVKGGLFHGVQLWVNLPRASKWEPPRYQDIEPGEVVLLTTPDGGALIRLIAGTLDGHGGAGMTHTPISYAHISLSPGARVDLPWPEEFNALAYALAGDGVAGPERAPFREGQLVVYGRGGAITLQASDSQPSVAPAFEVLMLGGRAIREPMAAYGPFVMNTRDEIIQAVEDYQAGRMGHIPASQA